MQTHQLIPHPASPPQSVSSIEARVISYDTSWLRLRWRIEQSQQLIVPSFAGKGRADNLWQTTCFELFLKPAGGIGYSEWNLSPSERWAAYDFAAYREGMSERPVSREPTCAIRQGSNMAILDVSIPRDGLPDGACSMGLSAVIEEEGGVKSYWALVHPSGKPDFHDPACFAATLAAPDLA